MSDIRVGYGEDIHPLAEGRKLILAGVEIPFEKGLMGHSDADVAFHAAADAILGALALGDIGRYFPPDDKGIEGIDSRLIVRKAASLMEERGYKVANIDVTILAEAPKLSPYIGKMRESLASALGADISGVSVKAGTEEGFGAVGEGKAIRAVALAALTKEEGH
jgi:2-C-methyl-D-erythritol 2,4-cyclodiphosphate synthase